jgi:hypothetical protein
MVEIGLIKIGQGAPKLETMEDYNKTSGTYFGYGGGAICIELLTQWRNQDDRERS